MERSRRQSYAAQLVDNELLWVLFREAEEAVISEWKGLSGSDEQDVREREALHCKVRVIGELEQKIRNLVSKG